MAAEDVEDPEFELGWEPATPEIASIEEFLQQEHQAQSASHEALYDLPVEDRVAAGRALDGVRYVRAEGEESKLVHVFRCAKNNSRFRPGTRLRLSRRDPRRPAARMELVEDRYDGKEFILRLSGAVENPEELISAETWVLDEEVFDLLGAQLSILHAAQESSLGEWLAGEEDIPEPPAQASNSVFTDGLEENMRTAFDRCALANSYFSVQGPPGSGKTHLLARLALHFALEENMRVLVTAVSHQAIHHALGEIYWVGRRLAGLHMDAEELLSDSFYKLGASRGRNEGLPAGIRPVMGLARRKRPVVVGATLYAAQNAAWGFSTRPFDIVLFDEAGQAPLILALAARLLAPKVVFIGDDAQLPPVVASPPEEGGDAFARLSTLEFIRRNYGDPYLLTETRRLNARLCSVVSECFYNGRLEPSADAAGRRCELKSSPQRPFDSILSPDESLVFVDVPHENAKSSCEGEAAWAAAIAAEAVRCGLPPEDVGIIAPYRAQCNRIRFLLGKKSRVLCSTVERFQGQEREMVILSLTSSHIRYLARLAGFLFDPHRLNVAISRARTKVVILGSRQALVHAIESGETADPDAAFARGFEVFRRILDAACLIDVAGKPPAAARAPAAAVPRESAEGEVFEPGDQIDHPMYGPGRVLAKSSQRIDNKLQWVNEMRFADGTVRLIVPGLSRPPIKKLT
ncbi:MAG: ATP-binding protein [Elusimicrobiota bacterium]